MGACLITDWKINLPEMFEPDAEIVAYRTPEECAEKVRYLLDHESERQAIAAAGQRRTLQDHTYEKRSEQLDSIVKRLLLKIDSSSVSAALNGQKAGTGGSLSHSRTKL